MHEDRLNAAGVISPGGSYIRSDSMPAASIRLALEEKRREHEKKRYLETFDFMHISCMTFSKISAFFLISFLTKINFCMH